MPLEAWVTPARAWRRLAPALASVRVSWAWALVQLGLGAHHVGAGHLQAGVQVRVVQLHHHVTGLHRAGCH